MDAVTPKGEKQAGVEGHSHIVRPAEMEWRPTSFPGGEAKPLYIDAKNGIATLLMKFAPGAVLPDHEHVMVDHTYVISGRLVDKEGPAAGLTVGPGEFVWREPGSRHAATTPEGGVMIAMSRIRTTFS